MATAAQAICAPVLYHVQWDDEVFPRDGQFELFDALASTDKQLIAKPGPHGQTHPDGARTCVNRADSYGDCPDSSAADIV